MFVLQVAWKPDSKQLLTASGDKTCKLWDVETRSLITEFNMGTTVDDQQVCNLYNQFIKSLRKGKYAIC